MTTQAKAVSSAFPELLAPSRTMQLHRQSCCSSMWSGFWWWDVWRDILRGGKWFQASLWESVPRLMACSVWWPSCRRRWQTEENSRICQREISQWICEAWKPTQCDPYGKRSRICFVPGERQLYKGSGEVEEGYSTGQKGKALLTLQDAVTEQVWGSGYLR